MRENLRTKQRIIHYVCNVKVVVEYTNIFITFHFLKINILKKYKRGKFVNSFRMQYFLVLHCYKIIQYIGNSYISYMPGRNFNREDRRFDRDVMKPFMTREKQ